MDKIISIGCKDVGLRATALTPRLYRHKFGRDILRDIGSLRTAMNKAIQLPEDASEEAKRDAQLTAIDLETFENVAYIMAYQFDPSIPDTPDEWLDQFETFSIYQILPEILNLWGLNEKTTAKPKKK